MWLIVPSCFQCHQWWHENSEKDWIVVLVVFIFKKKRLKSSLSFHKCSSLTWAFTSRGVLNGEAFLFKEQSPCQRVLLFQTMPEGGSPRAVWNNKTRGQGDCSYYNTPHGNCLEQQNIWKRVSYWLRGFGGFCWEQQTARC